MSSSPNFSKASLKVEPTRSVDTFSYFVRNNNHFSVLIGDNDSSEVTIF